MVKARCAEMGIRFDRWQEGVGTLALGKDEQGKYAATVGGVVLSIPRQVGKTFLVGALVIALCTLIPNLTVLWTAHRIRTSSQTFRSLSALAQRKKVAKFVRSIRAANGEQEIRFLNGSAILFGARERGFGRGFDSVDIEVFDEAQILTEAALEDMVPAANASRQSTGALLFFMGTPPRPIDPGEEFTNRRQKALAGELQGVYVEFSADADASGDDLGQIAKANPSFPDRTPLESIQRMREQLTDEESFLREAMGVWSVAGSKRVISDEAWSGAVDAMPVALTDYAVAVDVAPDGSRATISLAGRRPDGRWQLQLVTPSRAGVDWVVPELRRFLEENPKTRAVVVDVGTYAKVLVDEMTRAGIKYTAPTVADVGASCEQFRAGVVGGDVLHNGDGILTAAVSVARRRQLRVGQGDLWAWDRKDSTADITPLVASTLALWGAQTIKANVTKPKRGSGRAVSRGGGGRG